MYRDTQIFTPNDFPEYTYVVRKSDNLEERVRESLEIPKQPISISGPSKSGKTVLIEKVIGSEHLIKVSGIEIRRSDDLWQRVLEWMDSPNTVANAQADLDSSGNRIAGTISLPGGAATIEGTTLTSQTNTATETRIRSGLSQVSREISGSDFVVFIDDFHYMPSNIQADVAREIKTAADRNIKICIASVPHRSDDVVRSNHELRGRTVNIDTGFWSADDLTQIGTLGFPKLNIVIDNVEVHKIAVEACGSPQLMQAICLAVCRHFNVRTTSYGTINVALQQHILKQILEDTSLRTDYSSLLRDIHQGPRTKGQPRDRFNLTDGSNGDVYRCLLLALRQSPTRFQIGYGELIERVGTVCADRQPTSASVQNACRQITKIAVEHSSAQRIIEWDERSGSGTLSIVDPYFLFFLRNSNKLDDLKK